MHAQIYDFNLSAGGVQTIPAVGDYYKILTCSGPVMVVADTGPKLDGILAGQGMRDEQFNVLTLVDRSGAINTGKILVASGAMVDDRVTGEVSVIEGGKIRTAANMAFMGVVASGGAAGYFPHTEVWNPPGSGVNTFVSQVVMATSVGAQIGCGLSVTKLANVAQQTKSKKFGAADGKSQSCWENNVAQIGGNQYAFYTYLPANTPIIWKPTEPFMLTPGSGLICCPASTASAWVYTAFDVYEEPI